VNDGERRQLQFDDVRNAEYGNDQMVMVKVRLMEVYWRGWMGLVQALEKRRWGRDRQKRKSQSRRRVRIEGGAHAMVGS